MTFTTACAKHCTCLMFALMSPVMANELRPLSTDRPDTTESPFTVDRGHWQMETEIASWTLNGGNLDSYTLGEANLKYGLTDSTDLQVILPTYVHESPGDEGFGDIQVRLKHNLWGNDDDSRMFSLVPAMALMPYLKLPMARGNLGNGDLEGGLILPVAMEGPAGWSVGLMAQLDFLSDQDSGGVGLSPLVSIALGHDLIGGTAGFVELVGILSPEGNGNHEAYFNAGITWLQTDTLQWDAGIRAGLTSASADFSPFVGVSMKY